MKLKELAIHEFMKLDTDNMVRVYELIQFLRSKIQRGDREHSDSSYLKVRRALRQCSGSLTEDILSERSNRI